MCYEQKKKNKNIFYIVPCLLNIIGIVLFERLGWGIGQVGISGVLYVLYTIFVHWKRNFPRFS